ncbi:MAG: Lrp/AsnC family transcriptional regulator [Rhodoferax sp.]
MGQRESLDSTDRRLVKALSDDGLQSVNDVATQIGVTPPTVRTRMRALIDKKALRVAGQLNLAERPELISALVGINASDPNGLGNLAERLAGLPCVVSVSVVTGRFDLIVEVLIAGDIQDLYLFTSEYLPQVAGRGVVSRSETFVVMKSCNKWVNLPQGCWDDAAPTAEVS